MNTPYLQFQSLRKQYRDTTALASISFDVPKHSVLAVLGPNGAGKSTLFSCLLGFTAPTAGQILVSGFPVRPNHRLRFGYLAERVALYPHLSVWENGRFFCRLKNFPDSEFERQLKRLGLYPVIHRKARQLSKGMLQRLGLAIALCGEPELLVLDEPFNGLDPALVAGLQKILGEEKARGATLLISTHTIAAVEPLATHALILLYGQVACHRSLPAVTEQTAIPAALPSPANFQHDLPESLEELYQTVARHHSLAPQEELIP